MDVPAWDPRRVSAVAAVLPDGTTPPGTRGRILLAALTLYAEAGFHGTSIRSIATKVGINSATLYAHYPSKEQVLADLVLVGHRELHDRLTETAEALPADTDPVRRVAALLRTHVLLHTDYPLLATVINNELHALSPELAAPALELRAGCRRILIGAMERGLEDGVFETPDPLLAATAIGSMNMQVARWFGPDQPYTRDQVADAYVRFALRIVGIPESSESSLSSGSSGSEITAIAETTEINETTETTEIADPVRIL
jgi:AcrR family transcriptional regulator